jgi:hypothetical protein
MMAKRPEIEVGDELLLKVGVVRVDEHDAGDTVTFAISTASGTNVRLTIRQDSDDIVEVMKASKA